MFASNLRAAREAKGLTISALARASNVHRVTLHRLEAGGGAPRMDTLDALAKALDVLPASLLAERAPPRRAPRRRLKKTG